MPRRDTGERDWAPSRRSPGTRQRHVDGTSLEPRKLPGTSSQPNKTLHSFTRWLSLLCRGNLQPFRSSRPLNGKTQERVDLLHGLIQRTQASPSQGNIRSTGGVTFSQSPFFDSLVSLPGHKETSQNFPNSTWVIHTLLAHLLFRFHKMLPAQQNEYCSIT